MRRNQKPAGAFAVLTRSYFWRLVDWGDKNRRASTALKAAFAIAQETGVQQVSPVAMSVAKILRHGFSYEQWRRAVRRLEAAGFIRIHRRPGRSNAYELLDSAQIHPRNWNALGNPNVVKKIEDRVDV